MKNDIILSIENLEKVYKDGFQALSNINLEIRTGEIFALLGPNGAGKTTLINAVCGLVKPSSGTIKIFGHDNVNSYRLARTEVGLVPQELTAGVFETVWEVVSFSRALYNKEKSPKYIEFILKKLFLWEKRFSRIVSLSGGMKRRVLIAKALSHEPKLLFLDEPSAGVDVELRKSILEFVRELRNEGISIVLTTHYIDEAERIADRVGVINHGKLLLVEEKNLLMERLSSKAIKIELCNPLKEIPSALSRFHLSLEENGKKLIFTHDSEANIAELFNELNNSGIKYKDIDIKKSSLEEIFINITRN